jgi:hypothetical protein
MSDQDIRQSAPVFTHHGLLDMIQDPNANRDEVLMHLQQLINDANQLNQQNATLQAEVDAQAQILNSSNDAPLLTLTASLRSIAQGNQEAIRIQQENRRAQEAYQASITNILNHLTTRSGPAASNSSGRQSIPVPFSDKEKFKGPEGDMTFMVFKAQLQAQINKLPHAFLTDVDRVTYAFQCMSGAPAQYFAMLYNGQLPDTQGIMSNYKLFLETTDRLFGDQHNREDCEHKLARLRQANGSFHDYLIRFRELSSRTEWNEAAILARFKDGLSVEIKNILAAQWTKFTTLDETIAAANLAAQNVKTRELFTRRGQSLHQQHQQGPRRQQTVMVSTTPAGPSPMDLDSMSVRKLPADEYKRRRDNNLCLYCGGTGHRALNCPLKKPIQASVITEYQGNDEAEI